MGAKRILLLTDGIYPFTIGGMQKHSLYFAQELINCGCKLDIISACTDQVNIDSSKKFIRDFFNDSSLVSIKFIEFPKGLKFPGHYLYKSYLFSRQLFDIYKKNANQYDLIYIQGFTGWKLLSQKRKFNYLPKLIVNFHGLNMFQKSYSIRNFAENIMLRYFVKYNLRRADYVISLGGDLTTILNKMGLKGIIEQPNAISKRWLNTNYTNPIKSCCRFLFIGRDDKIKGFENLRQTLIRNKFDAAEFHFVGEFLPFDTSNKLIFHGKVDDEMALKSIYDFCDVLLICSYNEGMPTVLLEAFARHLTVLTVKVGAISQVANSENAIMLAGNSSQDIYYGINQILSLEIQKLEQLKSNAYNSVSRFTWDKITKQFLQDVELN